MSHLQSSRYTSCALVLAFLGASAFLSPLLAADTMLRSAVQDGASVRALGMGNAFTAIAEEGPGIFYNPAGLSTPGFGYRFESFDLNGKLFNTYSTHSLHMNGLGFGYLKKEDKLGNFAELTYYGLARRGKNGIDWGVALKTLKTGDLLSSSSGWSADLGMMFRLNPGMQLGFTIRDFYQQGVTQSTSLATGLAFFGPNREWSLSTDWVLEKPSQPDGYQVNGRVGGEYYLSEGLTLRAGYFKDNWTAGASFNLSPFFIDYGTRIPAGSSEPLHMIAVRLGLGIQTPQTKRRYSLFKPKAMAEFKIGSSLIGGQTQVSLLGGTQIGSNDLLALIHEAAADPSCEGFVVRISNLTSSLGSIALIQEIRNELVKAKQHNKKVVAYLENWATLPEYYLATVADKIIMPELGTLSQLGLQVEVLKTKTFLNTFGITPTIIANGAYKDMLSSESDGWTTSQRGLLENVMNNLYRTVMSEIKESRKLSWKDIGGLFDGRTLSAREAKRNKLVDELGYYSTVQDSFKETVEDSPRIAPLSEFAIGEDGPYLLPFQNRIAVIEIDGVIQNGRKRTDFLYGSNGTGADDIDGVVSRIQNDSSIKGVIVRVNSPGGSVLASDQIYTAIGKLRKKGKKVVVSMGNIAASGGYYVSLNSDMIVANSGTLTGSIGVISQMTSYADLYDWLGIEREIIKTGTYMDTFSPNKKLSTKERSMLQTYQNESYQIFIEKVIQNRKLTNEEVKEVAQGQIFTGEQALKLKLIDKIGGFYDAVEILSKVIQVEKPQLVYFRPKTPFWFPFQEEFVNGFQNLVRFQ